MELRHLRYFLKLAEELNFNRAAEKLFISQPPLSRQIKELETEINARLFNRNNKRVELTEAGKYFESEIKQVLNNLDRITLQTQKIAENVSGEFRIAYISSTFSGIISDLIKHLSGLYPYVSFKLYEVGTAKQIVDLEKGKLDLGILRAPIQSLKIHTKLWFKDGYALVYNKKYTKIRSEKDFAQLSDATFVFFNKNYAPHYYNSLLEICAYYGFSPNVVHESNNINSIIQLVRNGLGVSIVPANLAKNYSFDDIEFLELKNTNLQTSVMLATPMESESEIARAAKSYLLRAI